VRKPQTVLAIKKSNRSVSAWAKKNKFTVSAVNDILHKRGYYIPMDVPNDWTNAYVILQQLIKDGYSKQLEADGWDPKLVDINKHFELSTRAFLKTKVTSLEEDVVTISSEVCELGDIYTCNIFLSPTPDAGPVAILFMMEKNARATRKACEFLNKTFIAYKFYVESSDVITIWTE
jgi:hypothetical protein